MIETILKNVRKGSIFRKYSLSVLLYVRGYFDRKFNLYCYHEYDDYNTEYYALGSNMVYVDDYESLYDIRKSFNLD